MTELDMSRVNDWLEQVRNTFINASELAGKVAGLQQQVNEMLSSLEGLRSLNRTLEENLSWSRSERDRLENELRDQRNQVSGLTEAKALADKSEVHWRQLADERASIITTLRFDIDATAFKNLELEEENEKLKAIVDGMQKLLNPLLGATGTGQAQVVDAPKTEPVPEPKVVPYVHPVTGTLQGRDTETQQFKPAPQDSPMQSFGPDDGWDKF
jgi:chromosome segregation ATPase